MQSPISKKGKSINEKEEEILSFWQANSIFEKSVVTPSGQAPKGMYTFYDGPPFATGLPHHGHILAGTIKDAIPRYQTMNGKSVRRVWGWDCHGLPIENIIEKELNLASKKDIIDYGIDKFNKKAEESVLRYEAEWKKIIPRLGRFVDMDHPYATMNATYTESVWWAWSELYKKGLAYEGNKMMHICPRCETTLAQSEVGMNYEDVTDLSVTVKFELVDLPAQVGEPVTYVLAWTTTPWTLPGNVALALKKDADYVKVSIEGMEGVYILAKDRVEEVLKDQTFEIKDTFLGEILLGKSYKPLFPYFVDKEIDNKENIWKIWHADFITLDTGTGIAHEAPAFGEEDMQLAKANNIPIIKHVKMDGTFTDDVIDFVGMKVKQKDDTQSADIEIIKWLAHHGVLFEKHKIIHSYPLCWRCKTPLLNYATSSWFVDVPKLKPRLLEENAKISWTPEHVRDGRFGKWLDGAREWAVSRTRFWGAPLPVWKNADGSKVKVIGSLKELAEFTTSKPKNTYYVMRHGESESNVKDTLDCDGDTTNGLTEKGREQARAAAKNLSTKIDLIVSSPFLRGRQTSEEVSNTLGGIPIILDERLKEINLGIYDGKTVAEYKKDYPTVTLDTRPQGAETHREVIARTLAAWQDIETQYEGKTILIVTHGSPGWMLYIGLSGKTDALIEDELKSKGQYLLENTEVVELEPVALPRDEKGAVNLHRPYIDAVELEIDGEIYKRIPDVFDCWFESGSMPFASLHYPFENQDLFKQNYPADFIAEGLDQTRGWFYSLINLGVGLFDKAPYKHVIVNGLVLAKSGLKLSKSEKNYTDPMELVAKYGADSVRYFLLSSPVVKGESVEFHDEGVEEVYKKLVTRLENVVALYEMNLPDNISQTLLVKNVLDAWIFARLNQVAKEVTEGFNTCALDEATRPIEGFIDDLSVWYVRRSRERLKGDLGDDEQANAYTTLHHVLLTLSKLIAPSMPFLAERVYKAIGGEKESVHLESWPKSVDADTSLIEEMVSIRRLVSLALMKRTEAKIKVRQPLALLTTKNKVNEKYLPLIMEELNVKAIEHNPSQEDEVLLDTTITLELQKEGDIRELIRAVQDLRKIKGLIPKDRANLAVSIALDADIVNVLKDACTLDSVVTDTSLQGAPAVLSFGEVVVALL